MVSFSIFSLLSAIPTPSVTQSRPWRLVFLRFIADQVLTDLEALNVTESCVVIGTFRRRHRPRLNVAQRAEADFRALAQNVRSRRRPGQFPCLFATSLADMMRTPFDRMIKTGMKKPSQTPVLKGFCIGCAGRIWTFCNFRAQRSVTVDISFEANVLASDVPMGRKGDKVRIPRYDRLSRNRAWRPSTGRTEQDRTGSIRAARSIAHRRQSRPRLRRHAR